MKYEAVESLNSRLEGFFEPIRDKLQNQLFNNNGITQKISDKLKSMHLVNGDIPDTHIDELLKISHKPEDWLEICFYTEQNAGINHERLWLGGLEKFNSSGLYLENLGYFYYQKGKYHKALDYLSKSHAFDKSFFALTVAIAAAYAVTQYHLVLDYYLKLGKKEHSNLNDDLLFKIATSAQYEGNYDLAIQIFEHVKKQNNVQPLPTLHENLLEKFGDTKKMKAWSSDIDTRINNANSRSLLSIEESITFASILIYENKFDTAIKHLETIKSERFN